MRAILTYHSIDDSRSAISVTPLAFKQQIEWLARQEVRVVPLNVLLTLPDHTRAVALTFDDGIANVATLALPILAEHGITATVFVVSRQVGKDNRWEARSRHRAPLLPLLNWEQLGSLFSRGWTIGSHSRSHRHLPSCSAQQLDDEVEGAADDITAALGARPAWFAYPYGAVDGRVAARTALVYELACTTDLRALRTAEQPALLPRIDAWYLQAWVRKLGWGSPGFRAIVGARRLVRAASAALRP